MQAIGLSFLECTRACVHAWLGDVLAWIRACVIASLV